MDLSVQPQSRDERWEQARSLAAEQQALRNQRSQTQAHLFPMPSGPPPGEVQRVAVEGLIGSKRLAENLQGMLRDKPKFHFFQTDSRGAEREQTVDSGPGLSEPAHFVRAEPTLHLPLMDRRPRRAAEDLSSPDLNLSPQNRQRALTQGLPGSVTARAAALLFSVS